MIKTAATLNLNFHFSIYNQQQHRSAGASFQSNKLFFCTSLSRGKLKS